MSEWKEYKLGEVADILPGYAFKSKDFGKNGIPVIKIKDIVPPSINMADTERVDIRAYELSRISKYIVRKGDYVIAMTGATIGKIGKQKENALAYLNQRVARIKAKDGICDDFIYYSISSEGFQHFVQNNLDSNSVQENISATSIGRFPLMLPPLDEQKRIAGVLSSLDDKIDLLHRENATLEALAETLFRHYFIENPNPDWKEGKLESVVEVFDSRRKPLSKMERDKMKKGTILYPYYGAAEIMDYIDEYLFDGEFILLGEDGTVRTDYGYPILQLATGKFWPNNHAHVLQAKKPFDNCFLWYYFKTTNIDEIVTGAVQPKINQANLMSLSIYDYPIGLVVKFQTKAEPIWNKIKYNQQQMKTLAAQRDMLLPRLMSGEVEVTWQYIINK